MSTDYATLLRDAYAAFATGDLAGFLGYCTEDIVFIVPGTNQLSGRHTRAEFGPKLIQNVMMLTNGTFRETVLDVYASDRGGVVYAHHTFERDGRTHEYRTLHRYDFRDGKLASFREIPEDAEAFERAWA